MLDDEDMENGAVGRTTPMRTGAINASAISISSSIEIFIRVWNTRRHVCRCFCWVELGGNGKFRNVKRFVVVCCVCVCVCAYLLCLSGLGNRSKLNMTNIRETDRMNRRATICASSARAGSSLCSSLVNVTSKVSNGSLLQRTNKLCVNLSSKVVPLWLCK